MTKLVPTRPHAEPALESAVPGMSVYRAARQDARAFHELLHLSDDMAIVIQGATPDHPILSRYRALLGRASR
jgi:hypothetical protein